MKLSFFFPNTFFTQIRYRRGVFVNQVNLFKINKFEVLKRPKNRAFAHNVPLSSRNYKLIISL